MNVDRNFFITVEVNLVKYFDGFISSSFLLAAIMNEYEIGENRDITPSPRATNRD